MNIQSRFLLRSIVIGRALLQYSKQSLLGQRKPVKTVVPKILIAHYLLFGDTLLLAPLLKTLRQCYPQAEIYVLVRPAFFALFANQPYQVKPLAYHPGHGQYLSSLLSEGPFDLAIVPDDNRYAWLARAAGAKWIVGFEEDRPQWKNWMVDCQIPFSKTLCAFADMLPRLVYTTDALQDRQLPQLAPYAPNEWSFDHNAWPNVLNRFSQLTQSYAILHVGASSVLKAWPSERWRMLADWLKQQYGYTIVWSGGKGEEHWVDAVGVADNELNLVGQLSMAELISLVAHAKLLVCPDTGIAHLGRVVQTPTVALFGPGSVDIHGAGLFWQQAPFRAVTEAIPCRNQTVLFRRILPWAQRCGRSVGEKDGQCGRATCMESISLLTVQQSICRLMQWNECIV